MKKTNLKIILSCLIIRLEKAKHSLKSFELLNKTLESFGDFTLPTKEQMIKRYQSEIELYEYLINEIKKENRGIK